MRASFGVEMRSMTGSDAVLMKATVRSRAPVCSRFVMKNEASS